MAAPPDYVRSLEKIYGPASDAGIGSAVFFQPQTSELEAAALDAYRRFLGEGWTDGGSVWTSAWACCHERPAGGPADVVEELNSLTAMSDRSAGELLLDLDGGPAALQAAFDDSTTA